jgi:N-methylhydantoinase B/oxoprolinase/acetone carboxylase alpha subunit
MSTKRRIRRTPEQIIADLEAKIAHVKARAVSKSAKRTESVKTTVVAIRAMDKGMRLAEEEGDTKLHQLLSKSRTTLSSYLESKGIRAPKERLPLGLELS